MTKRRGGYAAIDSQIFIWGIKEEANDGQTDMIDKAKALISHLAAKRVFIVVPAIVLGECILNVDDANKADFVAWVKDRFRVVPFDSGAVVAYSRVAARSRKLTKAVRSDDPHRTSQRTKVDCFVLASAIAAGASTIYTCDSFFEKVAGDDISVESMPDLRKPKQGSLLDI